MKKAIIILMIVAILVTSCAPTIEIDVNEIDSEEEFEEVEPEEVIEEEIPEEVIEEEIPEEVIVGESLFKIKEGESAVIFGKTVAVTAMTQPAYIELTVDGVKGKLQNTNEEEIINMLRLYIDVFDFKSDGVNEYVTLHAEELILENNQYVLVKGTKVAIDGKEVVLEQSKSTGHIYVSVYDLGTVKGSSDVKLATGETKTINTLSVTNLENYYDFYQYAIVEIN